MKALAAVLVFLVAAACRAGDDIIFVDSALSPARVEKSPSQDTSDIMRSVGGITGWVRADEPRIFTREGLYGHINGGADLVLQYGFRELAVYAFEPARGGPKAAGEATAPATKEIVLEIYRMESGEAAFGLYSTRIEGEEERWPDVASHHWVSPGQANLVKSEYLVNILASECTDEQVMKFSAAVERKIPGTGTVRPAGMNWLPTEGMVRGSGRYIKGALSAQNESPLLEGAFWGFGEGTTEAYSARYGAEPALSKLIVVEFKGSQEASARLNPAALIDSVLEVFREYLQEVRNDSGTVEGRNQAGRIFLFRTEGRFAALILGEPDEAAARARLDKALRSALSALPS